MKLVRIFQEHYETFTFIKFRLYFKTYIMLLYMFNTLLTLTLSGGISTLPSDKSEFRENLVK